MKWRIWFENKIASVSQTVLSMGSSLPSIAIGLYPLYNLLTCVFSLNQSNNTLKASTLVLLLAFTKAEAVGVFMEKSLSLRSLSFKEPVFIQITFLIVVFKLSFLLRIKSVSVF